ncbi:MAG: hypothetical protein AUJ85_07895, partial [Elusimicrobia bacterium CG1_02_37_114]
MNKKMTRIRVTLNSVKGLNYPKFYKKVWIECMKIPEGETRTYKQIAEKIGHPKAYRAVGSALAGNPFAPFIPCHRVIRSDGKLGNYSGPGGIKEKKSLLKKERK